MNISRFFIQRPIFAAMLSRMIFLAGLIALPQLPISEYPEVVPPTIVVRATYPGANPKVDRRHRRLASGAGNQRRRGHAVPIFAVHQPTG